MEPEVEVVDPPPDRSRSGSPSPF